MGRANGHEQGLESETKFLSLLAHGPEEKGSKSKGIWSLDGGSRIDLEIFS